MRDEKQAQFERIRQAESCDTASPTLNRALAGEMGAGPIRRNASIRQRIDATLREGERTYARMEAAQRARLIIDAHPEFADLLDALGEF